MTQFANYSRFGAGRGPDTSPLIFLTAGQSNATNFAKPLDVSVPGPLVTARGLTQGFAQAFDPQPTADNVFSSPWPRLGDALVAKTGRPVKFLSVGVGNTQISEWVPGTPNYQRITDAINLFNGKGFTAFLWHQGENDAAFGTTQAAYTAALKSIIDQIRTDAGWTVPCGIAVATHPNEATGAGVSAAQIAVGTTYLNCFQGANTDTLDNTYRYDNTHFNTTIGTEAHANLWYQAIVAKFGL